MSRFELSITCTLLILSSISCFLQIGGISGCDYVRIHFKALNDDGIYFNNDPYVGLGLIHHQEFLDKNTRDWEFDSACKEYNSLEIDMFTRGNLKTAKILSLSSIVINAFVVVGLVYAAVRIAKGVIVENRVTAAIFNIVVSTFTATALALQAVAVDKIHDEEGICDRDSYFPHEWNEKYPFQMYPQYAYFKFFHECKLGPDGHRARASIIFSALVCAVVTCSAIVSLMHISDANVKSSGDVVKKSFSSFKIQKPDHFSIEGGLITEYSSDDEGSDYDNENNEVSFPLAVL